jgi:hypothetical protein
MRKFAGMKSAGLVLLGCGLVGGAVEAGRPAHAQQFSSELISSNAAGEAPGGAAKLYVAGRKVRIETPQLPGDFLIVDAAVPAAYLVRPAQRVFMDAKQSSQLSRLFVPVDPADPCRQWQTMAEVAGITDSGQWHCNAPQREVLDGRTVLKYAMISLRGHSTGWIDPQLAFPLKIETEAGDALALRSIREAPQPPDKFEIPGDYKKFDPRALIEQIKHSDVWVDPRH